MGCKVLLPPGRWRCVQCRRGAKTGSNSINLRRGKKCSAAAAVCAMIYGGHRWRGQGTNLFIVRITFYYQVVRRGSPSPPQTLSGVSIMPRLVSVYQQMRSGAPLPLLLIYCVGASDTQCQSHWRFWHLFVCSYASFQTGFRLQLGRNGRNYADFMLDGTCLEL